MAGEGDEGNKGKGVPLDSPEVKAAIEAAVQAEKDAAAAREAGLVSKRDELLGEVRKLKSQLPEGFDLEEYQRLLKEHEDREEEAAKAAGKWDELRDRLITKHETEIGSERERRQKAEQALVDYVKRTTATAAIARAEGSLELLEPHVLRQIKVDLNDDGSPVFDEAGAPKVTIVDAKGEARTGEKGEEMSVEQLLAEMKEDDVFAPAFRGTRASGGGANGSRGSGGARTQNPWAKETRNLTEQGRILKQNPAQAKRLMQEAGAAG